MKYSPDAIKSILVLDRVALSVTLYSEIEGQSILSPCRLYSKTVFKKEKERKERHHEMSSQDQNCDKYEVLEDKNLEP